MLIPGDNQIDVRICLRRSENQSVRHSQRFETSPKAGCCVGNSNVNGQYGGEQPTEESRDVLFGVMPEASAGQNLGVGNHGRHQPLPVNELANRRVRGIVESILSIEKANDDAGVEDYRHSPRSPSTRSRKSPLVSKHPE